jgi:DNA-binding LytR/AlgR family response regulator
MLKTLIIDDEPLAHEVILGYAKSIPFIDVKGQCYLATEAFTLLQQTPFDLIFLDIHMPKLKGLDFLRSLPNPPLIILATAYEEYALESYELDVCDYLLKPFRFERFAQAANKALERYQLKQNTTERGELPQHILIKSDKKHIQLKLEDIYYLESYGNFVKVWLDGEFLLTARTLSSFLAELPDAFCRIHKSYIINRQYLDFWEGNYLRLKNEKELPIGKSYRKEFREIMLGNQG